jgi:hypothetical protein
MFRSLTGYRSLPDSPPPFIWHSATGDQNHRVGFGTPDQGAFVTYENKSRTDQALDVGPVGPSL